VRSLLLILAFAPRVQQAKSEPARPHFAGVDLFGTTRFTVEQVRARLGADFDAFEAARLAEGLDRAGPLKQKLEAQVKQLGGFAFAEFSVVQYFREGRPSYLTVDVVERDDAARRIAVGPAPTESLVDPGGLIAVYRQYEESGWELMREGAARHADELFAVLHRDRDEGHRATAAFLLAFTKDGERLVKELASACKDPSSLVRNNALRVFAETARHHPEVELPLDVVLDCLEFPATTDRNKASAILEPRSRKPELRETILRRAGPTLLAMLRLEQPNNHDFAWSILKNLSGESYGERDYDAWRRWLSERSS